MQNKDNRELFLLASFPPFFSSFFLGRDMFQMPASFPSFFPCHSPLPKQGFKSQPRWKMRRKKVGNDAGL
jgi:hypothetical protein